MTNEKVEKYIIIFCVLVIIFIGLTSCAKQPKEYKPGPFGLVIENAESVGTMIGCMFAPKVCEEHFQDQEWKKVDEDLKKSK